MMGDFYQFSNSKAALQQYKASLLKSLQLFNPRKQLLEMKRGQKRKNWVTRKYTDLISNPELRHRLLTSAFTSHGPPT